MNTARRVTVLAAVAARTSLSPVKTTHAAQRTVHLGTASAGHPALPSRHRLAETSCFSGLRHVSVERDPMPAAFTPIPSTSSPPARRASIRPNIGAATSDSRPPRPPVIVTGDVLVSRSTARADVYDISVAPAAAHMGKTRYQDAIDAGRLLARGLAVDGWFSCDHTHYVRIATYRT